MANIIYSLVVTQIIIENIIYKGVTGRPGLTVL